MGDIVLAGATSGTTTLTPTAVSGTTTLTLPATTGTITTKDTNGILSVNSVQFPATQSASEDANCLDDYEEGTWTPSIGGNATYNEQVGYYTKIGNFVKLRFHINVNVLGTGSTTTITGIPFTPASSSPSIIGGVVCYANTLATSVLSLGVYCQNTANIYFFTRNSSSTGATTQQPAVIGNNFDAYCEISYLV